MNDLISKNLERYLSTRVDKETGERFDLLMQGNGHKRPSSFLRELIEAITRKEPRGLVETNGNGRAAEVRLVLNEKELAALDAARGSMPRTTYTLKLLRRHLINRPEFDESARLELKASNRELWALGKNINQMAKQLNISLNNTDVVHAHMLEDLRRKVLEHTEYASKLLDASLNRWGIKDEL